MRKKEPTTNVKNTQASQVVLKSVAEKTLKNTQWSGLNITTARRTTHNLILHVYVLANWMPESCNEHRKPTASPQQ